MCRVRPGGSRSVWVRAIAEVGARRNRSAHLRLCVSTGLAPQFPCISSIGFSSNAVPKSKPRERITVVRIRAVPRPARKSDVPGSGLALSDPLGRPPSQNNPSTRSTPRGASRGASPSGARTPGSTSGSCARRSSPSPGSRSALFWGVVSSSPPPPLRWGGWGGQLGG